MAEQGDPTFDDVQPHHPLQESPNLDHISDCESISISKCGSVSGGDEGTYMSDEITASDKALEDEKTESESRYHVVNCSQLRHERVLNNQRQHLEQWQQELTLQERDLLQEENKVLQMKLKHLEIEKKQGGDKFAELCKQMQTLQGQINNLSNIEMVSSEVDHLKTGNGKLIDARGCSGNDCDETLPKVAAVDGQFQQDGQNQPVSDTDSEKRSGGRNPRMQNFQGQHQGAYNVKLRAIHLNVVYHHRMTQLWLDMIRDHLMRHHSIYMELVELDMQNQPTTMDPVILFVQKCLKIDMDINNAIRKTQIHDDCPIIVIAVYADEEDRKRSKELCKKEFAEKYIQIIHLVLSKETKYTGPRIDMTEGNKKELDFLITL